MSTGTTTPKTTTTFHPSVTWASLGLMVISAVYTSYLHGRTSVVPVPVNVNPAPVNPVQPVQPVDPNPSPPTPADPVTPIATGVTIADLHGNPLGNSVEAGHAFSVSAANGLTLTAIPTAVPADSDVIEFSDSKLICTLRNGATLQIVVTGGGVKPSVIAIQCNHAPNPPPVVKPVVNPVNPIEKTPVPVVPAAGVRVVILRDAMRAMTKDQVAACDSPKVTDLLNAKCAKDAAGRPAWHRWDKDVDVSNLPNWKQLLDATKAKIQSDSLGLPLLVIEAGNKLHLYEITDESAMLNTLNAAFAGGV